VERLCQGAKEVELGNAACVERLCQGAKEVELGAQAWHSGVGLGCSESEGYAAMPKTSLAERMSRLEQQKVRLAEQEAKIKADERKQRTKRLIEAGTLVEQAGLLNLEDDALYGALLSLAESARDEKQLSVWASAGKKALDRETKAAAATRVPLTVTFPAALPTEFSTRLRRVGLRWNKVLQHWEGLADHATISALAGEHDGNVSRIAKGSPGSEQNVGRTRPSEDS
jgi:hypothetical protein